MGNHVAGRMMGLAAEKELLLRKPCDSALAILDRVCESYRSCDAEFEAEDPARPGFIHPHLLDYTDPHPQAALGLLMVEAFAPNGLADLPKYAAFRRDEQVLDLWAAEVDKPFMQRFDFC